VPSRRDFVRLAGLSAATGSGLALAACGAEGRGRTVPSEEIAAVASAAVLAAALEIERTAATAYETGIRLLGGRARALAGRILSQERDHADALEQAIERLGGAPSEPQPHERYAAGFPPLRRADDFLAFAIDVANTASAAYLDALPKLSSPEAQSVVSAILANEAQHLALLSAASGRPPLAAPFVRGTT
jgi:rubrerythrin